MSRLLWLLPLLSLALTTSGWAAPTQVFRLKEYLGHTWSDELISYPLEEGLRQVPALKVTDETGTALPYQVFEGRVYLLITLPADREKVFTITQSNGPVRPARRVTVSEAGGFVTLDSGVMAARLLAGAQAFDPPAEAGQVPGPLQGVRAEGGDWIGRSSLQTSLKVVSRTTTVAARGPLFAEATVDYAFEGGKHYRFTLRAIAGQPTVIIDESMDLNPGGHYALLSYDNDADASSWEWWNLADSSHLSVTAPDYPRANAVFTFSEGFRPNQCRWVGGRASHPRYGVDKDGNSVVHQEAGELFAPLTYEQEERFNRIAGWWLNSFSNYSYCFTVYDDRTPDGPAISLATGRPSRNVNPTLVPPPEPWIKITTGFNDLAIWTRPGGTLEAVAPICLGSREWLLTVQPQSSLPAKGDLTVATHPYRAVMKYSHYPLDKVKDWCFDWPEPENAWPRLFCKAGDLETMRTRVATAGGLLAQSANVPAIYRADGTPEAMVKQVLPVLKAKVEGALAGTNEHGSANWFHASLHMMQLMPLWEAAMATPGLSPEDRARIKAYGAFIAQRAWDDDYWPPKETANGWGSANMGILAAGARVLTAAAMAGMPRQEQWLRRCRGYLDGNMIGLLAPDGGGVSCPHYLGASVDPVMYMALALKFGGGYDVFAQDPRWRRFAQFMMDILTPPDPRSPLNGFYYGLPMGTPLDPAAANRRNMWPLGHTSRTEPSGLLGMLALGLQGVDDELAGALRQMDAEQGQSAGGGFVAGALLLNTASQPREPDLRSRWYPSYGAIMRDRQPEESWLAVRYGKFAFDHFQADMGAFTWFAKGVPLMMDFGSMYSPESGQAVYHNRLAWDVREGELQPCPGNQQEGCFYRGKTYFEHKFEPWTCKVESWSEGMGPTDSYGEVKSWATLPAGDYLLGQTDVRAMETTPYFPDTPAALAPDPNQARTVEAVPPFSWLRQLLMVKATRPHEPSYLLVRDDFTAPCPPPMASFWVMATDLQFQGRQAHATGQFGVDLEIYVAQPSEPALSQWQWEHKNWGGEKQLCLRVSQPGGQPFLTLLYPRRPTEPLPAFTAVAGGNGVRLVSPGPDQTVDHVFLSPERLGYSAGGINFEGTVGYVRTSAEGALAVLLAGGKATVQGTTLEAPRPAQMRITEQQVILETSGVEQVVRLSGNLPARRQVRLDGKPMEATIQAGVLSVTIPAGEHQVVVG